MVVMKNTKRVNGAKRTQSFGNNYDAIHNYYRALESLVKTTVDGRRFHCIGKNEYFMVLFDAKIRL